MKHLKHLTFCLALIFSQVIFAQSNEITGTVTDGAGMPIIGANVLVQGTSVGAATDFDGNYSINAAAGDVLVFSYIGFKQQEVTVTNEQTIVVSLEEDTQSLDEVVVVAYGTSH